MQVLFTPDGWQDFTYWITNDKKILERITVIINDINRDPFRGIGKPEPLKQNLVGWWSRRVTDEHRMVYRVKGIPPNQFIEVAACRQHY